MLKCRVRVMLARDDAQSAATQHLNGPCSHPSQSPVDDAESQVVAARLPALGDERQRQWNCSSSRNCCRLSTACAVIRTPQSRCARCAATQIGVLQLPAACTARPHQPSSSHAHVCSRQPQSAAALAALVGPDSPAPAAEHCCRPCAHWHSVARPLPLMSAWLPRAVTLSQASTRCPKPLSAAGCAAGLVSNSRALAGPEACRCRAAAAAALLSRS